MRQSSVFLWVVLFVSTGALALRGYWGIQRLKYDVNVQLSDVHARIDQTLRQAVTTTTVSVAKSAPEAFKLEDKTAGYKVVNGRLMLERAKSPAIVLVDDIQAAGFRPVECGAEDVSVYFVRDDLVFLQEGCGEMGGTMWAYSSTTKQIKRRLVRFQFGAASPSPDGRYQVILGPAGRDGEVRTLIIKDFINDKEFETKNLPLNLSYRRGTSEFDGSPLGRMDWVNVDAVYADVYDARTATNLFDDRYPVLKQYINLDGK